MAHVHFRSEDPGAHSQLSVPSQGIAAACLTQQHQLLTVQSLVTMMASCWNRRDNRILH